MMSFWARLSLTSAFVLFLLYLRRRSKRQPLKSFTGQRVLITGGGSGLGAALAHLLNSLGAELILCGRSVEKLRETARNLPRQDLAIRCYQLDLNDLDAIDGVLQGLAREVGHVHCLINNAGQSYRGRIADTKLSVHEQLMRVDYLGHVAVTSAWMKYMCPRASNRDATPKVVFVSSVQGRLSIPYRSAYSAAKHALHAFVDCLRAEEPWLQVLCFAPGYIRTNLSNSAVRDSGALHGTMDATTARGVLPEAAAEAVLRALEARAGELTMAPIAHRAAILLRALSPTLCAKIMARRAAKSEPY